MELLADPVTDFQEPEAQGIQLHAGYTEGREPASDRIKQPMGHRVKQEPTLIRPEGVIAQPISEACILEHWLLLTTCWTFPSRSLVKATAAVRSCAQSLALALRHPRRLTQVLTDLAGPLTAGCRINSRRAKPNTYQLLLDPSLTYELPAAPLP